MKWTNLVSTITAVLTAVTGIMATLFHCSSTGDLAATCSGDILPAKYMVIASSVFGVLTLVLKMFRPGGIFASLFGETAVVVPEAKSAPGVVTPAQVASQ
jgi:lysylphosphatidylglycerol synthetase-like protein (DUF2156 family)